MALSVSVCDNLLQDRYHTPGTALHRAMVEAPYIARCSDNKTAALTRPRELAIRLPYMQYNRPGMVSRIVFDLDHANPNIWEDAGLPPPNLIVRDRSTNKSQLHYAIETVCTTTAGRSAPIAYLKAIYEAYVISLNADVDYRAGAMAKTPGHPWWDTTELHSSVYTLGQLAEYVELVRDPPWAKKVDLSQVEHSRHCMLFEMLRHYAYSIVNRARDTGTFQSFTLLLEAYAHNRNTFARMGFKTGDLPRSSLRATVKSVARWTWDNYTGTGRCHRGAMRLDDSLPIPVRQRMGAEHTHEVRRKATESKIRVICQSLRARGDAITMAAVARLTQLTRQTVAKYKHVLTELASTVTQLPAMRPTEVKYGAHQVSSDFVSSGHVREVEGKQSPPVAALAVSLAENSVAVAEKPLRVTENGHIVSGAPDSGSDPPPF